VPTKRKKKIQWAELRSQRGKGVARGEQFWLTRIGGLLRLATTRGGATAVEQNKDENKEKVS